MDFEVHCMFILPTELSLFNYDKVKTVLQSVTPLISTIYHFNKHNIFFKTCILYEVERTLFFLSLYPLVHSVLDAFGD